MLANHDLHNHDWKHPLLWGTCGLHNQPRMPATPERAWLYPNGTKKEKINQCTAIRLWSTYLLMPLLTCPSVTRSLAKRRKLQNGLSRMSPQRSLLGYRAAYSRADAAPMLLPHSRYRLAIPARRGWNRERKAADTPTEVSKAIKKKENDQLLSAHPLCKQSLEILPSWCRQHRNPEYGGTGSSPSLAFSLSLTVAAEVRQDVGHVVLLEVAEGDPVALRHARAGEVERDHRARRRAQDLTEPQEEKAGRLTQGATCMHESAFTSLKTPLFH